MATIVQIRGKYLTPKGLAATGTVSLALSTVVKDTVAKITYEPVGVSATLAVDGTVDLDVIALTGDANLTPTDAVYTITEAITGTPVRSWSFSVNVSDAIAGIDIGDLAPAQAGPQLFQYVLQSDLKASNVPFTPAGVLTATNVQAAIEQATSGLSDASTTNKGIVKLAGDLGGTADIPTVPGLAGKANTAHTHAEADVTSLTTDLAAKLAKASNLSDIASASTARTNLGLGGAATLNVGTAAGTVAAGNDSRFLPTTDVQVFTSSGTWTMPAGAKSVTVKAIGAGGGGGAGRRGAAGTVRLGGNSGSGGAFTSLTLDAALVSSPVTVTVGAAGAGGAAQTVNDTDGAGGTSGGDSTFGSYVLAGGGPGGPGGAAAAGGSTNGGRGLISGGFGTACQGSGVANAGSAVAGGAGGGSGGGIPAGNTANAGGKGGQPLLVDVTNSGTNGAAGGVIDSTAPVAGTSGSAARVAGGGGGGGASSITTAAQTGAAGGAYGGGGGGGGASVNGFNSGGGGNGAAGIVTVTTYF